MPTIGQTEKFCRSIFPVFHPFLYVNRNEAAKKEVPNSADFNSIFVMYEIPNFCTVAYCDLNLEKEESKSNHNLNASLGGNAQRKQQT